MKVRLITPVGTRAVLRIYWGHQDCPNCCGTGKPGCHNAERVLYDSNVPQDHNLGGKVADHSDPSLWSTKCDHCSVPVPPDRFLNTSGGYWIRDVQGIERPGTLDEGDVLLDEKGHACIYDGFPKYQVFHHTIYDSGVDHIVPGDMWWTPWIVHDDGKGGLKSHYWDNETDPRGHLMVKLPNGHDWDIDSRCSNCTRKDDRTHRCWVRHGEPPNIHVDKKGDTCSAGAGSIIGGDWHGFLHHGELVKC